MAIDDLYSDKIFEALKSKMSDDEVRDLIVAETGVHPVTALEFVLVERYDWSDVVPVFPHMLPNGRLLVPRRAEGPDDIIGDGMVEIGPDDPDYKAWRGELRKKQGGARVGKTDAELVGELVRRYGVEEHTAWEILAARRGKTISDVRPPIE